MRLKYRRKNWYGGGFDPTLCLIRRFLTNKLVITHMMKDNIKGIWSLVKGVEIRAIKMGVFIFQLFHKLDVWKVLSGGLWFSINI